MKPESNAQECLHKLCDELLGKGFYIVDPVGGNQANEIITKRIIKLYKPVPFFKKLKNIFMRFLSGRF